jgi:hypothetical protein
MKDRGQHGALLRPRPVRRRGPGDLLLDDADFCVITELDVPPGLETAAATGAQACPERAIRVID